MKIAAAFLLLGFSLQAQAPPPAKSFLDKSTLEAYLRYAELWIPQVTVKIDDPKPSTALDGFYDVAVHLTFNGSTKDESYYISKDGRNVVKGQMYEVGKSPFQSNLNLLKPDQLPNYGAGSNATVNLVVFSDFQCPYCQKEELDLRKNIPMAFGDKVRVSFADFPLTQIHPWAMKGSIAGRCVSRNGAAAFWDYHDWVYQNQTDLKLENFDAKLQEYATKKGLDALQLGRCMDDKSAAAEVEKNVELGHQLGVSATPTLFINGRKLDGGVEWKVLQQLLQIEIDHKTAEAKTAAIPEPKKEADNSCCTVDIPKLGAKK
jgi:protein-disulfide isomerase